MLRGSPVPEHSQPTVLHSRWKAVPQSSQPTRSSASSLDIASLFPKTPSKRTHKPVVLGINGTALSFFFIAPRTVQGPADASTINASHGAMSCQTPIVLSSKVSLRSTEVRLPRCRSLGLGASSWRREYRATCNWSRPRSAHCYIGWWYP